MRERPVDWKKCIDILKECAKSHPITKRKTEYVFLAKLVGVSGSTMTRYLNKTHAPNDKTLKTMWEYFYPQEFHLEHHDNIQNDIEFIANDIMAYFETHAWGHHLILKNTARRDMIEGVSSIIGKYFSKVGSSA